MRTKKPTEPYWDTAYEQQLIHDIQRGESRAYTEIYGMLYPSLHRYAVRLVRSHDLADDVVQDVFARLWRRRATWIVRDTIAACLHRAIRNRALDVLRQEHRKRPPTCHVFWPKRNDGADDALAVTDLAEALAKALDTLSPRERQVFLLNLPGTCTYAEIGDQLGIARNTVRVNLIAARRRLAHALRHVGILERVTN